MSIGNPKKFKNFDLIEKNLKLKEKLETEADSSRLYKNKNSRIKKELAFTKKKNKSKLT